MNSTLWDATSWATEKNLHTDQERTQYRKRFNQPKPFQKRSVLETSGRLKVKKLTYEPMDMRVTGFGGKGIDNKFFEDNGKKVYIDQE